MSKFDDLKQQYKDLKRHAEDLKAQINEIRHGHIHIPALHIDYDVPDEIRSTHHWLNRIYIWVGASLLGVAAICFALLSDGAAELFYRLYEKVPWAPFLLTPFGLVGVRYLIKRYFSGSEGSGIPQVIAALQPECTKADQILSFRQGVGKILGTILGLLCGASIGREGPTVQLGAIILRSFGRYLRAPVLYSPRSLILAGGAAGVSAAFNTPIAGIVFAIEELGRSFYEKETSHKMARIIDLINLVITIFVSLLIVGITLLSTEIGFISTPALK